ncbi:MAG: amino acid adenylation domain-containing protein [Terracidiphilus sp.]
MHAHTMNEPAPMQFHAIAQRHPTRIALQENHKVLSYRDLDQRAGRLAHYLLSRGVQHGDIVALCMPRSIDWTVAALAIWRLGAAYAPLDISWPEPRIQFALQDSGAKAVIAESSLLNRLGSGIQKIDILADAWRMPPGAPALFNQAKPDDLAYVIYTSGSTGEPKGVEITHANLSHLIEWHLRRFSLTHRDRTSHLASLGFDAAVWEIWPALCAGATLCIAEDPVRLSTDLLQQWLIKEQITVAFVPTIQATALMDREWPLSTALRFMLTGADVLPRGPRKQIPFVLVNNYGPTECTVLATSGPVMVGSESIPTIGKPIPGSRVYLLDLDGEPVADGELGEIYIGGAGVGRGYRNLPDETRAAFRADPFSLIPGARMYKTGDLGVRGSNGEIEFKGRIDRQVKIHGKRVELSEIDSALARHQDLSFATTQARAGSHGEVRLIAYVVAKSEDVILSADLFRKHLAETLPSYMVPAHFVRLLSIPLLTNGKLDQKTLESGSPFGLGTRLMTGWQSQIGDRLLTLVQELLEYPALTKEDDFFLAGGHSLFGMQLILRIEEAFGAELSLQQILEFPTVNQLSAEIEWALDPARNATQNSSIDDAQSQEAHGVFNTANGKTHDPKGSRLAPPTSSVVNAAEAKPLSTMNGLPTGVAAMQPNTSRRTIFWIHYLHGNLARAIGDESGFFAIRLALEDFAVLGPWPSAPAIAHCMMGKILQIQPTGPFVIGGMCVGGILAYEVASQLRAAGHEVSLLILVDAANPRYRPGHGSVRDLIDHSKYLVDRARHLGARGALQCVYDASNRQLPRSLRRAIARSQVEKTQVVVESAALSYHPQTYGGPVLMLVASDCSPHKHAERGWHGLMDGPIATFRVDGHHSELAQPPLVGQVAEAILSHLISTPAGGKEVLTEASLTFEHN